MKLVYKFFYVLFLIFSLNQAFSPTNAKANDNDAEVVCFAAGCVAGTALGLGEALILNDVVNRPNRYSVWYGPIVPFGHHQHHRANHGLDGACAAGCLIGQCVGFTAGCCACILPRLCAAGYECVQQHRSNHAENSSAPPTMVMTDHPTAAIGSADNRDKNLTPSVNPPTYTEATQNYSASTAE